MSRPSQPSTLPAELEDNIVACRRLTGIGSTAHTELQPAELDRLRNHVDAAVASERGVLASLRSLKRGQRLVLLLAMLTAVAVAVVVLTPRADMAAYPAGHMAFMVGLLAVWVVGTGWWLWRPLHRPPPARGARWLVLALAVGAPIAAAAVPISHVGAPAGAGVAFVVGCLKCLAFGAVLGVPIGALALAIRRAPIGGGKAAALAGVVAGLVGNLALQVHCPITDPAHLLCGHAPLLVALAALAALLGRGALAPRR